MKLSALSGLGGSPLLDVPLLSGPVPVVIAASGAACGLWLICLRRQRSWPRTLAVCLVAAAALTIALSLVVEKVWQPFPDRLGVGVLVWVGIAAAGMTLAAARMVYGRSLRERLLITVAALIVIAASANQVNVSFEAYPTVRDALQIDAADEITLAAVPPPQTDPFSDVHPLVGRWEKPADVPARGKIVTAPVPGFASGFDARSAEIYLPPAYFSNPRPRLPVLVLIAGQPGSPQDWLSGGRLAQTMDRYAIRHNGLSPVVAVADGTGSTFANPLCMDSRRGRAATYLAVDVPNWIKANLQIDDEPRAWAVGGYSYGGTCSMQLATNFPQVYPTFVDLSGDAEPTLGDRRRTIEELFGGDAAAFDRVNPLTLMRARRYPATGGALVAGTDDADSRAAAATVATAARAAGMSIEYLELPGGHTFKVWANGLEKELEWITTRLGLDDSD